MADRDDFADLLARPDRPDAAALDRFVPAVYDELRRVARAQLRGEQANHSLQPTALVHEVYLRLVNVDRMTITGRSHFLALAARLMRQVLVDHARRKLAAKRGGGLTIVGLDAAAAASDAPGVDILALDEALTELASLDPRQREIVELKFFGGLTIDETAAALQLSPATIEREWAMARAWLYRRLSALLPRPG
jgi:RNA polymerase sigma factor (TIGR02999 family)